MKTPRSLAARGAIAGILAATALVLWFFITDSITGEPLRTPRFLAGVLGGAANVDFGGGAIAIYTIVHYVVFIVIGILTAYVADWMDIVPSTILGFVLGFLLFDVLFYGSVAITGVDVVNRLGWPVVLAGNVIAGLVLFGSLARLSGLPVFRFGEMLQEHRTIREGLITGLIGAVLVAAWFLIADVAAGRPVFFTPAALGSALLRGATSVEAVEISLVTVLGYTVVHVAAFILTGLVAAMIFSAAENIAEAFLLGGVLLFVTFEVFSIGILAIVSQWLLDTLNWWNIAIANLVAAASMGAYLVRSHRTLMRDLGTHNVEEELADERSLDHEPHPHGQR